MVGSLLGLKLFAIVLVMVVLSFCYSVALKRLPLAGNICVAALCASTLPFGSLSATKGVSTPSLLASGLVFGGMLVFEIGKTLEDWRADFAVGMRTIACVLPRRFHVTLVVQLSLIYTIAVMLSCAYVPTSRWWLFALVLVPVVPLWSLAFVRGGRGDVALVIGQRIRLSKALWPLALIGLLALL